MKERLNLADGYSVCNLGIERSQLLSDIGNKNEATITPITGGYNNILFKTPQELRSLYAEKTVYIIYDQQNDSRRGRDIDLVCSNLRNAGVNYKVLDNKKLCTLAHDSRLPIDQYTTDVLGDCG